VVLTLPGTARPDPVQRAAKAAGLVRLAADATRSRRLVSATSRPARRPSCLPGTTQIGRSLMCSTRIGFDRHPSNSPGTSCEVALQGLSWTFDAGGAEKR